MKRRALSTATAFWYSLTSWLGMLAIGASYLLLDVTTKFKDAAKRVHDWFEHLLTDPLD